MEEIPLFDEFGFRPAEPFATPTWVWVVLTLIVGFVLSFSALHSEEEEENAVKQEDKTPHTLSPVKA